MKKEKKLSLILMIISAFFVFIIGNFEGFVLAIVSLIISIKNLKEKEKLNKIAFVGSIIIIIISIFMFIVTFNTVNKTLSSAKDTARLQYELLLEINTKLYSTLMIENGDLIDGENIITEELLDKYELEYPEDCESYILATIDINDKNNNTFKAYLKCEDYTTTGFDENNLK